MDAQQPKPKRLTVWLLVTGVWGAACLAAVAVSRFAKLDLWVCFGIAVVAILANGMVAMLEDDLPGGLNNPDGTHTPKYALVARWIVRGVGVAFLLFCIVALGLYFFG